MFCGFQVCLCLIPHLSGCSRLAKMTHQKSPCTPLLNSNSLHPFCLCCHRRARKEVARSNKGVIILYCYLYLENTPQKRCSLCHYQDRHLVWQEEKYREMKCTPQKRRKFWTLFPVLEELCRVSCLIQWQYNHLFRFLQAIIRHEPLAVWCNSNFLSHILSDSWLLFTHSSSL